MLRKLLIGILFIFCGHLLAATNFLTLSDLHYGARNISGNGNDTNDILWLSTLAKFKQLTTKADFIIMLGDLPSHFTKNSAEKSDYEAKIFHDLFEADITKKPLFYVSGNNDPLTGNYLAFSQNEKSPLDNALDWNGACANCDGLLIDDANMRSEGYYSTYVSKASKDVILIVLNTTQFINVPYWFPRDAYPEREDDATRQLGWLSEQLKQHQARQLLIAMHEEPGVDYQNNPVWNPLFLQRFIQILNSAQGKNQQISLLTAHSHYDELRKITLDNNKHVFSYATPSISRSHYNNSGMKMFSLTNDFRLKNFTTYYTAIDNQWNEDHYQAIGSSQNSIFPSCSGMDLAQCLESLSNEQVCARMESEHIYGVKNPEVNYTHCLNSYKIQLAT
ncbi:MAG: metallophosphoesterase [Legionella sp.]|nr:metallophosphoesterase [Legionella sp.]